MNIELIGFEKGYVVEFKLDKHGVLELPIDDYDLSEISIRNIATHGYEPWQVDRISKTLKEMMLDSVRADDLGIEKRQLAGEPKRYKVYFKDVASLEEIDVYQVHTLFDIQDPSGCIHHASKKLLLSGVRTGGKDKRKDIEEARDTLNRWLEINRQP